MPTLPFESYDAFQYQFIAWKLLGIFGAKNCRYRRAYITYAILLNICVTLLIPISFIINIVLNSTNLVEFCNNFYLTISFTMCTLKIVRLFLVRKKLQAVRPILQQLDGRVRSEEEVQVLRQAKRMARLLFVAILGINFVAIITGRISVYFAKDRKLEYEAWYPLDPMASYRNYLILNTYNAIAYSVVAIQNATSDTYPAAYLTVLSAHIKALILRIGKIGRGGNSEKNYKELVDCIKDHLVILKLSNTIKDIVSFTCLTQFLSTGLAQCTVGIYILYVDLDYVKYINVLAVFALVTIETFGFCYFGDRLKDEYSKLANSIYFTNWTEQDIRYQKALLLFMMRTQKDEVIMAGNLIPVCLATFVQVLKTAYSVFAVLNELK